MTFSTIEFRNTLGCFATGVAIITANCTRLGDVGLTINSFSSVSLEPPLILWSINRTSDLFETFMDANVFTVNFLNSEQQQLSTQFSRKEEHSLENYSWQRSQNNCKFVPESLAHLDCETIERFDGGDHIIFVGKVLHFESRGGTPLIFSQGKYRQLKDSL